MTTQDLPNVIGLTLDQARAKLGKTVRAVKVDGKSMMSTADHKPNRLNVETVGGKITKIVRWG